MVMIILVIILILVIVIIVARVGIAMKIIVVMRGCRNPPARPHFVATSGTGGRVLRKEKPKL